MVDNVIVVVSALVVVCCVVDNGLVVSASVVDVGCVGDDVSSASVVLSVNGDTDVSVAVDCVTGDSDVPTVAGSVDSEGGTSSSGSPVVEVEAVLVSEVTLNGVVTSDVVTNVTDVLWVTNGDKVVSGAGKQSEISHIMHFMQNGRRTIRINIKSKLQVSIGTFSSAIQGPMLRF